MKVSIELEDLVRLAGVQHEAPAPPAEPEIPSDDGAPVGGGCGMHPTQDMRDTMTLLSPQEAPVDEEVYEHETDDFENASPEFSGAPVEHGDIDDMSFRGFGKTRGKEADAANKYGDNPLNEDQLMAEWQNFKKKELTTPVKEAGWDIGLGGIKLGSFLGGLKMAFDKDGNAKLGGRLGHKLGPLDLSVGTDDLSQWSRKKQKTNSAPKAVSKNSKTHWPSGQRRGTQSNTSNTGYNTSLKPGQPGYKSALRRRQEAASRNQ